MDSMNKNIQDQSGFTLIEIMVTLAIVGIMSGIAIAGYLSWKPGYVFRGAVSQIRGDLNRAKMRAVENRRVCRVIFNANGYTVNDGDRTTVAATTVWTQAYSRDFSNYPGVSLVASAGALPLDITFTPRGTSSNGGTIQVVHSSYTPPPLTPTEFTTTVAGGIRSK